MDKCCKIVGHNLYFLGQARYCARARGEDTKIKWVRFGRPKSSPLIDPFYDGNWKAELGMATKIVPGKPLARFGSRKRELSATEPCAAEIAYQELVEPGCQFFIDDPEYGGLCADYSALSDDEGLSTTPLHLPSCYPNKGSIRIQVSSRLRGCYCHPQEFDSRCARRGCDVSTAN